jgi:PST family polysaccharide transporter
MVTKSVAIALPAVGLLFGLEGVAAGYSLALLLAWPVCMVWLGRAVQMPVSVFMKQGARIIAAGAIIFGATRALSLTDVGSFPVLNVCLALAVTVISLSACCALPAYRRDARALISMFKLLRKGT